MNKAKIAAAAASAGVLAIGWQVGSQASDLEAAPSASATTGGPTTAAPTAPVPAGPATTAAAAPATTSAAAPATTSSSATQARSTGSLKDGTFTGTTETHRFGSVTVTITVSGGRITEVVGATEAHDGKSQQINSRSVPQLRTQVLAAQSASVRTVSGATYTSEAYLSSLQAALDKARA